MLACIRSAPQPRKCVRTAGMNETIGEMRRDCLYMQGWLIIGTKCWLRVTAACLALLLVACGDDSQQARETLISWSNSLELVEQQRGDGRVPETYVRQMTHAATTALNRNRKHLRDDPVVRDLESAISRVSSSFNSSAR
jgi:hypothetical protein